jgi:hypothetical protein
LKNTIKENTEKLTTYTSYIHEYETKITEIRIMIETSETDATNAEEEAINVISEGIEATYIVHKHHVNEKKISDFKHTEEIYKE